MKHRGWLGVVVVGLALAGCSSPEAPQPGTNPSKPVATARVKSSALTKKLTGATAWRVYRGHTQVVVLGFGKDRQPIDGIRFRYASKNESRRWVVSFETLKHGGVLQIDKNGKVIAHTMSDAESAMLIGASRVLRAWTAKTTQAGSALPKSFVPFSSGADCAVAGVGAAKDCGPLVATCARWGRAGAVGGVKGVGAAVLTCLAYNWRQTASCAASTVDAAKTCYEAWRGEDAKEQEKNPEPQGSADGKTKDQDADQSHDNGEVDPDGKTKDQDADQSHDNGEITPSENEADPDANAEDPNASGEDPNASSEDPNAAQEPQADESQLEADASSQDPEAPQQDQVDEAQPASSGDDVDANPSDPEESSIDETSSEDTSSEDTSGADTSSDSQEESSDVDTESFHATHSAHAKNACGASRVLHCGSRTATAFCRCIR